MEDIKFKTITCKNGMIISAPEIYIDKLKKYAHDNYYSIGNLVEIKMEQCHYVMSEFFKFVESL